MRRQAHLIIHRKVALVNVLRCSSLRRTSSMRQRRLVQTWADLALGSRLLALLAELAVELVECDVG